MMDKLLLLVAVIKNERRQCNTDYGSGNSKLCLCGRCESGVNGINGNFCFLTVQSPRVSDNIIMEAFSAQWRFRCRSIKNMNSKTNTFYGLISSGIQQAVYRPNIEEEPTLNTRGNYWILTPPVAAEYY